MKQETMSSLNRRNLDHVYQETSELLSGFLDAFFVPGDYSDFIPNSVLAEKFAEFKKIPIFKHTQWLKIALMERYPNIIVSKSNGVRGMRGYRLK